MAAKCGQCSTAIAHLSFEGPVKSDAPLRELRRIVRIPDEPGRVHALSQRIDNHVASCANFVAWGDEHFDAMPPEAKSLFLEYRRQVAKRSVAAKVSELISEEERNDSPISPALLFSLTVIVPEGVEHPRKRQARERAELEPKEATAS